MASLRDIDFIDNLRPHWASWCLLAAGAACAVVVGFRWNGVAQERDQLLAAMHAAQGASSAASTQPLVVTDPRLELLRAAIDIEWQQAFSALEVAAPDGIALLSADPDVASGALRLAGQASSAEAVAAYLVHLRDVGLHRPRLLSHQPLDPAAPAGAVRFSVSAQWRHGDR